MLKIAKQCGIPLEYSTCSTILILTLILTLIPNPNLNPNNAVHEQTLLYEHKKTTI